MNFTNSNKSTNATNFTNSTNSINVGRRSTIHDAGGFRVAERVNDVWRFSIFDLGGKCVAEYGGPQSNDDGGVKYVLQDWQGSTRAVLNNAGFVNARTDYTAFGENISSDVGLRTSSQGFGASDTLRQKYALTTRDDATGLDHTWFRKNENQAGRWTSPDPYNGSMSLADPQSFNRYSYVASDPVNFIDPSGLNAATPTQACSYSGKKDADGNPIYDGTIGADGKCHSNAGPAVQVYWTGGWVNLGGNQTAWIPNGGYLDDPGSVHMGNGPSGPSIGPRIGPMSNPADVRSPCPQFGISYSMGAGAGAGNLAGGTVGTAFAIDLNGGSTTTAYVPVQGGFVFGGSGQLGGVGYPSRSGWGIGAFADVGPSFFLSNVRDPSELGGISDTHIVATPLVTVQIGTSPNSRSGTLELGPGSGLGYFYFRTKTAAPRVANTAFRGPCGSR